jgi:hypothetical protein
LHVSSTPTEGQDGRALIPDRPALALPGIMRKIDLRTCDARNPRMRLFICFQDSC